MSIPHSVSWIQESIEVSHDSRLERTFAEDRSLLREVELLISIPLDPVFATSNGIPPHFAELAARVEERLA
jgi:hypothetical protein